MKNLVFAAVVALLAAATPAVSQETAPVFPFLPNAPSAQGAPKIAPPAPATPVAAPTPRTITVGTFCLTPRYLKQAITSGDINTLDLRIEIGAVGGCGVYLFDGKPPKGNLAGWIGTAKSGGNNPHVITMAKIKLTENVPDSQKGMVVFSWSDTGDWAI